MKVLSMDGLIDVSLTGNECLMLAKALDSHAESITGGDEEYCWTMSACFLALSGVRALSDSISGKVRPEDILKKITLDDEATPERAAS